MTFNLKKLIPYQQLMIVFLFCSFANVSMAKQVLPIEKWQTSNGTSVYYVHANTNPMVDIQIAFAAGSAQDNKQFGLAALTNSLVTQGAGKLNADEIATIFEGVGANVSETVSKDVAIFQLRSLTKPDYLNSAVETLALILSQPSFPENALVREKNKQLAAITAVQESPQQLAEDAFYALVFRDTPYQHPILGTMDTVKSITRNDLVRFHKDFYTAKNAVIAIVGSVDRAQAEKIAEQLTKNLVQGQKAPAITTPVPKSEAETKKIFFPGTQTIIKIGQLGVSNKSEDYIPLVVANYSLGGAQLISRLADEIREKRGLSYNVHSSLIPLSYHGLFVIDLGTRSDQLKESLTVINKTLAEFIINGPTDKELTEAKQNITGRFLLSFESNKKIADVLINIGFSGLPLNYLDTYLEKVKSVTQEDIRKSMQKHFDSTKLATVLVGATE